VELDFWIDRWQQGQIGFHQDDFNPHLQEYWGQLKLPPGATIFVPLCGKSRDMLWLLGQGYKIIGIEISPTAVRDFFSENELSPKVSQVGKFECWQFEDLKVLCGDFFDLTAKDLNTCAAVYDRAALIALPPQLRKKYAQRINSIMPRTYTILLITLEYEQTEMEGPPFSVTEDEVNALYASTFKIERLFSADVLTESPSFREKGLTVLAEKVYNLCDSNLPD